MFYYNPLKLSPTKGKNTKSVLGLDNLGLEVVSQETF